MKLFTYLFVSILVLGGFYLLVVDRSPPADTPEAVWEAQAQTHLTTLLADQLQAVKSQDWATFDADLEKAAVHLAAAPEGARTGAFRAALNGYQSQQELRAQLPR